MKHKHIRQATRKDACRIAEIEIFNYRLNFYPKFKNDTYYFGELQVQTAMEKILADESLLHNTYVYDDGVVKGFIHIDGLEIKKLFVEPILQGQSIGSQLLHYTIEKHDATFLWALEKNSKAIRFYERHGFHVTEERVYEAGTTEYLVKMERE